MTSTNNNSTDLVNIRDLLPEDIPILPLVIRPIFPNILTPIAFTGEDFLQAIKDAEEHYNGFIGLVFVKDIDDNDYFNSTLYDVGTVVKINKVTSISQDSVQAIVFGVERFKKKKVVPGNSRLCWKVKYNRETTDSSVELKAYMLAIMTSLKEIFEVNPILKEELKLLVSQASYDHPSIFIDFVSSMLKAEAKDLQELLEEFNIVNRSQRLLTMLKKELEISQLQAKISKQIEDKVSKQQKEYFLREQLKLIKQELGLEKDEKSAVIDKIVDKINHIHLSPEAEKIVDEQLEKLSLLDQGSPEYHVARTYIESIVELPWGVFSKDRLDIKKAKTILDRDHYGLEDIKNSILEFVSTVIKTGNVNGSILCLVGPPGVGKTSIGKSIAESLNRKFYRFSVGGMVDEAEIKGHRRTYIGAMPGKIIQALKLVQTSNPVIMIDEIDKIGNSFRGDPASALLEVLDPEQNKDFLDHYLDIRYDLSKILFVTTANQLDTIPRPLLDRMEIIHLSGYILEEKLQIAQKYLIPQQLKAHALDNKEITISKNALKFIIDKYAREAGVRTLDKCIRKIMRKVNLKIAEGNKEKVRINENNVESYLGAPIFTTEELYQNEIPGVTLGLAWTSMGGATLYIEAASISNKECGLKLTGQLGDVMKESAEIAYSYIRSLLAKNNTLPVEVKEFFDKNRVHLHVPEGATPKDGPSAGIAITTTILSVLTGRKVKQTFAMTGEITITGEVLPVGGIKEKVIGAHRAGIKNIILPDDNKVDVEEIPEEVMKDIKIYFASTYEDVEKLALEK